MKAAVAINKALQALEHENRSLDGVLQHIDFTRKVGHTQRGGRPILFDRFHAAQLGGKAIDMLLRGSEHATVYRFLERSRGKLRILEMGFEP